MNPSSSSNADAPRVPLFHVRTIGVSADFTRAAPDESTHDLGDVDRDCLEQVLARLGALEASAPGEADPQLLVKTGRGLFRVSPQLGRWLVKPSGAADQSWTRLEKSEIVAYLAEIEPTPASAFAAPEAPPGESATSARTGLVVLLAAVSALVVAGSAYFTFQPDPLDPDSAYESLSPSTEASAQAQAIGRFVTSVENDRRALEIREDGTLRWIEYGENGAVANERQVPYVLARRDGRTVLRAEDMRGPITLLGPDTLSYAKETYSRQR